MSIWDGRALPRRSSKSPAGGPGQLNVMPRGKRGCWSISEPSRASTTPSSSRNCAPGGRDAEKTAAHYGDYDRLLGSARPDLDVAVDILTDRPCTLTDAQRTRRARRALGHRDRDRAKDPFTAESRARPTATWLWALKHIPIVTMGAGDRQVPHQRDEWVDLDQLVDTREDLRLPPCTIWRPMGAIGRPLTTAPSRLCQHMNEGNHLYSTETKGVP